MADIEHEKSLFFFFFVTVLNVIVGVSKDVHIEIRKESITFEQKRYTATLPNVVLNNFYKIICHFPNKNTFI